MEGPGTQSEIIGKISFNLRFVTFDAISLKVKRDKQTKKSSKFAFWNFSFPQSLQKHIDWWTQIFYESYSQWCQFNKEFFPINYWNLHFFSLAMFLELLLRQLEFDNKLNRNLYQFRLDFYFCGESKVIPFSEQFSGLPPFADLAQLYPKGLSDLELGSSFYSLSCLRLH